MDKPLAFKEQEGWAPSFELSGAAFTGILWPTVCRCPHCRSVYKLAPGLGDVFLGKGERTCSKCEKAFRDRSQEWPELSTLDRFFFLFPGAVCIWTLLGIIFRALFSWAGWTFGKTQILLPAALIFVTPLIAWFVFRGFQVARSIHRFDLHRKAKTA